MCEIKLQELDAEGAVLETWLKPQGSWIGWSEGVFVLRKADQLYEFRSAMPGILHEHRVQPSDNFTADTILAVVEAEGDEIPYGRPWGTLVPVRRSPQ